MNNNKRQKVQTRRTIYCYLDFTLFGRIYFPRFFFTIKRQLFKTEAYQENNFYGSTRTYRLKLTIFFLSFPQTTIFLSKIFFA